MPVIQSPGQRINNMRVIEFPLWLRIVCYIIAIIFVLWILRSVYKYIVYQKLIANRKNENAVLISKVKEAYREVKAYNSIAVHTALSKCKALKEHKYIVNASLILCILICLSTIFLKQHSVYDVIGGIVLMAFMYFMLYILPERNTEAKCEAESQQQSITD